MAILHRYDCEGLPFAVVVDDDDRVAYAYLLMDEKIVGDVWLYNRQPAQTREQEWKDRAKLPFLNPRDFILDIDVSPITEETPLRIAWVKSGSALRRVELFRDNELLAILAPG